jgi:hypothetical protein
MERSGELHKTRGLGRKCMFRDATNVTLIARHTKAPVANQQIEFNRLRPHLTT